VKRRIYYIEDEPFLGKIVKDSLEKSGYEVRWETDGAKVLSGLEIFNPELVILDIMLPNVDGYTLCEQIRMKHESLPIIFLTAKAETRDLVKGFEAGGTDYMKKPFSVEELMVRMENQFHLQGMRNIRFSETKDEIMIGKYLFKPKEYELITPSRSIKLSQRELEVLKNLVDHINQVTIRKTILLEVWGDDSFFNSRNLDVYIRKLRGYFAEDENIQIQTLKGKGYLLLIKA